MNGPHDVGGGQTFGPLPIEPDEPLFHAQWERRALAVTLAMGATGQWNIDMSRARRESLPPARYLSASYYEIWFEALLRLLHERGLIDSEERAAVDRGELPAPAAGDSGRSVASLRVLRADRVAAVLAAGSPTQRPGPVPSFSIGDRVRVKLMNPVGHTRAPRYVRGRPGVVAACHGSHVFADRHAVAGEEAPQPLYTVRFDAADLWGPDTTADAVCVDCWESYLEPAPR